MSAMDNLKFLVASFYNNYLRNSGTAVKMRSRVFSGSAKFRLGVRDSLKYFAWLSG